MKTIKELEKEIESSRKHLKEVSLDKFPLIDFFKLNDYFDLIIKESQLEQTNKIKDTIDDLKLSCRIQNDKACWCAPLDRLLEKIQGKV